MHADGNTGWPYPSQYLPPLVLRFLRCTPRTGRASFGLASLESYHALDCPGLRPIALAKAEQANEGPDQVDVGNTVPLGNRACFSDQVGQPVDRLPDESKAGLGGVDFARRALETEAFHGHLPGEFLLGPILG